MLRTLLALLAALLIAPPTSAADESDLLPIDQAYVLTAQATARGRIEFTWKIAEGYYLYRHRMGVQAVDSSFKFNPLELPEGKKYTDEFFGPVETYRDEVTAVLTGAAADGVNTITFTVKYQGCADIGVCYPPHRKTITVDLPADDAAAAPANLEDSLAALTGATADTPLANGGAGAALPEDQAFRIEAIADGPQQVLLRLTPAPGYYLYRDKTRFTATATPAVIELGDAQWPAAKTIQDPHFGEVAVYFETIEVPLDLRRSGTDPATLTLGVDYQGCQTDGICYPPMHKTFTIELPSGGAIAATAPTTSATPLWLALLLALGGGLILNLMPCVLPVLSLKALSLAQGGENPHTARRHALWYTAGVLVSFAAVGALALVLREAGLALGWGFQLQQPMVVAGLTFVMFALGLSLSGVVNFGAGLAGAGQSLTEKSGPAGDFFTGVLAVVVASPCTAPFMGTALAFAFASSPWLAIAIFLALGLGLALPFLLIGWIPALARRLPRPGAWMETLKQLLAFPLYLTAVWLVWVLAKQRGADAVLWLLAGLVLLALGLWAWERSRYARPGWRVVAAALTLSALFALPVIGQLPAASAAAVAEAGVVPYSADALTKLRRDGRVVFVNMTADWCVSCKANEKTVLSRAPFEDAMAAANAVYMKGDWTNVDPAITAFLESHGAVGVPLYVVYPADGGPGEVLPTLLRQSVVAAALQRAAD